MRGTLLPNSRTKRLDIRHIITKTFYLAGLCGVENFQSGFPHDKE